MDEVEYYTMIKLTSEAISALLSKKTWIKSPLATNVMRIYPGMATPVYNYLEVDLYIVYFALYINSHP